MEFDIDVSGEDIFSKDFTICIADSKAIVKGFKFGSSFINIIHSRYGQDLYRYPKSKKGKSYLMRKDTRKQLKSYVNIPVEDVEKFLKKRVYQRTLQRVPHP